MKIEGKQMSKWRWKAYNKFNLSRGTNIEISNNLIKRYKYCIHEWRHFVSVLNYSWCGATKHWILAYFGRN